MLSITLIRLMSELLEDHADVAPQGAQMPAGQCGDLASIEMDLPGRGLDQPVDAADQGRFPGAAGADDCEEVILGHLEADALQDLRSCGAVARPQVFDF
jgi:hypothetical protein